MTVGRMSAYAPQVDLEDDDNALYMAFQVLHFESVTLSYWIEESNDGMTWNEMDRVTDVPVVDALTGDLLSSPLGGVLSRVGFAILDDGSGTPKITLRVTQNTVRR
jgi:hypothetical protein